MTKERTVEFDQECQRCGGTGLYVGMAERDGFAVECSECKGRGVSHFVHRYRPFEGRRPKAGVLRVLATNPGIIVAPGVTQGGVPTDEWERDRLSARARGKELRSSTCPHWWYQCADYKRKPNWDACNKSLGRSFSQCDSFARKAECWERFDAEEL